MVDVVSLGGRPKYRDLPRETNGPRPSGGGYLLAMLSHGYPNSPTAFETLTSFSENVDVPPSYAVYYHDGPGEVYAAETASEFEALAGESQEGFCVATRKLWSRAVRAALDRHIPYVFWLEHDFRFLRPFKIHDLTLVLRDAGLAQVALNRAPVNAKEREAGSVLKSHGWSHALMGDDEGREFVAHPYYFTTNPSLMRTSFMREEAWPADIESECEGHFGIRLRKRGYSFAIWGDSVEPWVEHFGVRTGHGY